MIQATGLSNIIEGGKNLNAVALGFVAQTQYPLEHLLTYWITKSPKPGYNAGTGGSYIYQLCADTGGQPGSIPLVSSAFVVNRLTENGDGCFPTAVFPPYKLTIGSQYWVVIRNVDPAPTLNWASIDLLIDPKLVNQVPSIKVLFSGQGFGWRQPDAGIFIPSPVLFSFADRTYQGNPWYQVGPNNTLLSGNAYGFLP